jgi:serum/glucocorticoid-regulated kinase 2
MKVLKKEEISEKKQKVHTEAERDILEKIKNPFIVNLHYAFQTPDKLYFILDFVNGGELFSHLRKTKKFPEYRAKFYAAEITLALEWLHLNNIIYRDLKPENILLDSEGHIKITDFGLSKQSSKPKTFTFCGTPEYLAPEIIREVGHDKGVDWWSLGALLYEMLWGRPPFWDKRRPEMFNLILESKPVMKKEFNKDAWDLLKKMLNKDPAKRLGNGPGGSKEIKDHPFFKDIDFKLLYKKAIESPYIPVVDNIEDTKNIDKLFTDERPEETPVVSKLQAKEKEKNYYGGFTYERSTLQSKMMGASGTVTSSSNYGGK